MNWASPTVAERFHRSYVPEPNSGCWIWTKSLQGRGYAQISIGRSKPGRANIVSYLLHKGEIPSGLFVRHTCDCRWCVNPDHLILGTAQDNVNDAIARGRHCHGERHGSCRLTQDQAQAIKSDARMNSVIAAEYGVSERQVGLIKAGRRWKHLGAAPRSLARTQEG